MKRIQIKYFFFLLCLLPILTGCAELFPKSGQNAVTTAATIPVNPEGETISVIPEEWNTATESVDRTDVEMLSTIVTENTIRDLEEYPNLKVLDLSGSTCYTAIMVYIQNHPQVDVAYTVDFGSTSIVSWAEDISLPGEELTVQTLRTNLVYLPRLKSLQLPRTTLSYAEIENLRRT